MGVRAGLGGRLARWATRRPHLLLAVAPGATAARLAVEGAAARMGMVVTVTDADADVLVVIGDPGRELGEAVERAWAQLPGPRTRTRVTDAAGAEPALRDAAIRLGEPDQAQDAYSRHDEWTGANHPQTNHDGGMHDGDGMHHEGNGSHDHHGHGGGHEGHGGPGMEMPGGLMMAERADDRDGLKLDVLHVPLGPVLADWPAGLVVDVVLQGDLVQHAAARVLPPAVPPPASFWAGGAGEVRRCRYAAAHLDSLGRLLGVAGWEGAAAAARRVRDEALDGVPLERVREHFSAVNRRVRRSRVLRWATDGLGVLGPAEAVRAGMSGPAARAAAEGGDVTARWRRWLTEAGRLLAGEDPGAGEGPRGRFDGRHPPSPALLDAATRLMVGLDIAAARLVLASFDPDPDELVAAAAAGDTG
jgi:hypothetical protein